MEVVRCLKDVFDRDIARDPDYMVREILKVKISQKLLDQVAKQYELQNEKVKHQKKVKRKEETKTKAPDRDTNQMKVTDHSTIQTTATGTDNDIHHQKKDDG